VTSHVFDRLEALIAERMRAGDATSYTAKLVAGGPKRIGKKLGEEAVEVVIAALAEDDAALTGEAADLIYHLIMLLRARGLTLADVAEVLESRLGRSGLEEKAARGQG
jgi:phosphoribosyl-ATP pyrophosphohydrolase